MTRAALLLGSALAGLPGSAWAQTQLASAETGDQTITVTATRSPTDVQSVPVTVTVIDEQRIADELATDVRDLVRFEPGVIVPRSPARFSAALGATGRDGNSGFRIRGIGGNRVLIQVDGIRVPDGFSFGAQLTGRGDYVDLGIVRSVEILRGPGSALYGSDGLAGVVSFITSDPADLLGAGRDIAFLARGTYDSASDEFSETALLAARSGPWSAIVSYTRRDGHELDNQGTVFAENSTRTAPNPQDTSSNALFGRLVFTPNDRHRVRLTVESGDTRVNSNVLSGRSATVLNLTGRDTSDRSRISLDWRYTGTEIVELVQASFYWQRANNLQFTFEDRTPAVDRTRINTFDNEVVGLSAEVRARYDTGPITHTLIFGGDASFTHQEGLRSGTVPPAGETFPTRAFPETDFTLAGFYFGDEIGLWGGAVTLFPAIRFDSYSLDPERDPLLPTFNGSAQDGSRLTPRFGIVGRLGGGFSLFGNYAQGFKAPAPSQVNQFFANPIQNYTSLPNPNLRPETSETFEAGIRYQDGMISAQLNAFTGDYEDFISQQQVGGAFTPANPAVFQVINLNGVEVEGIEGRIGIVHPSGFNADASFAWASGDVIQPNGTESPLSSIDPLRIVVGAGWRDPAGRFGAQAYVTHVARKPLDRTTGVCGASACFRPDASTVVDLTAFWRISENFTLRAGLFNVFDESYIYWGDVVGVLATSTTTDAYTQPGRNVRASLTVRF
jgi:hemoglobin/transferrin/lactoferrin receptor protein